MEQKNYENFCKELDLEEIMKKIRKNQKIIEIKKFEGLIGVNEQATGSIDDNLDYLISNADVQNKNYSINSHRPFIGKYLMKGRQLVHGEVNRYVDPVFIMQTNWNIIASKTLENIKSYIEKMHDCINEIVHDQILTLPKEIGDDIEILNSISKVAKKVKAQNYVDELGYRLKEKTKYEAGFNYLEFEDKFRGPRTLISERQRKFLPYFINRKNVLDIGCGRGEFLELMKENNIPAYGVDNDKIMSDFCNSRGLNAVESDALCYISDLEDDSVDGILIDQVVEHMEPEYLVQLLQMCYKKLAAQSVIVINTINPLSFFSLTQFFIDISHIRPVHPYTLKFLLEFSRFHDVKIQFHSPLPDGHKLKLKYLDKDGCPDELERKNIDLMNANLKILNEVLFGAQDYTIVGKKKIESQ